MTSTSPQAAREGALNEAISECVATVESLRSRVAQVAAISEEIVSALKAGNKVLTAGNGGSAAEALHMSEELVGRFRTDRASLPSVSLVADSTALTCIANDFGFDRVFSRQIEGLGKPGDVLVLFSTSGGAANLALALDAARERGMKTVCLLGRDGGRVAGKADHELVVDGKRTERIQEAHQLVLHLVLDAVEDAFPG
jgi:D-sedoheptulose 7-phosphate isomerase